MHKPPSTATLNFTNILTVTLSETLMLPKGPSTRTLNFTKLKKKSKFRKIEPSAGGNALNITEKSGIILPQTCFDEILL